jgi:hypothetical protein
MADLHRPSACSPDFAKGTKGKSDIGCDTAFITAAAYSDLTPMVITKTAIQIYERNDTQKIVRAANPRDFTFICLQRCKGARNASL